MKPNCCFGVMSVGSGHPRRVGFPPRLGSSGPANLALPTLASIHEGQPAQILAIEVQEIEGKEHDPVRCPVDRRAEGIEIRFTGTTTIITGGSGGGGNRPGQGKGGGSFTTHQR